MTNHPTHNGLLDQTVTSEATRDAVLRRIVGAPQRLRAVAPAPIPQPAPPAPLGTATAAPSARLRHGPPAAAPAIAAPRGLRITLVGELAEPAHAYTEAATGRAALGVVLEQGQGRPQVHATLWLGDGYEAMRDADARATALRAGDLVVVHGETLCQRYHHGALVLVVGTVRRIVRVADAAGEATA